MHAGLLGRGNRIYALTPRGRFTFNLKVRVRLRRKSELLPLASSSLRLNIFNLYLYRPEMLI